jgi:hypothetical protein
MKLLLFFFAFLAVLPIGRADLTVVQSIETSGSTNQITTKIKGERARIDLSPESSMIVDTKTGEVVTLMPEQKAVLRFSAEQAKSFGNKARALLNDTGKSLEIATPKATGKKEKINGYEAEEYVAETQQYRATYWVAKSYPHYQDIQRQMKLLQNGIFTMVRKAMPEYYDFPGLAIRTTIKFQGQPEATTTIASVSQAALSDSEFTVPDDYAEIHLPDFELPAARAPWAPIPTPEDSDGH